MSTKINFHYLYFFISVIIFISCSNDIIEININQEKKGSLKNNEYDYYKLTLPGEINKTEQLVFELEQNTELDSVNNIVSDPNLYISLNNIRPTETDHKWSSSRFGDETITINGEYLNPFQSYYIGVYCKEKCNYILKTSLVNTIIIKENIINKFSLDSKTVMKFSFKTRKKFNELSVNVVGSFFFSFNVYLAKKNPSSSNTLYGDPIFFNGYKFTIKNDDLGNNNDIKYDLIVDNRDQQQELNIWLKYDDEIIEIKEAEIIYDTISKNKASCYNYPINNINLNRDIIISTTLFNGLGFIYIEGYGTVFPGNINENYKTKENSYPIKDNKVIHLTEENFEKFGENNNKKDALLNFCFYAEQNTSLFMKVYFYENFKKMQRTNYIFPNIRIEDILPKKSLTKYRIIDFNIEKDIIMSLNIIKGKPKLYLYIANPEANNELLDYDNFQTYKQSDLVLEGKEYPNAFLLKVAKESNKCKINVKTNKYSCYLNAIVECNSDEECIYNLFLEHMNSKVFMEEKQIYRNVIAEGEEDPYSIIIIDPSVKNIAIVLTQITGRTELKFDIFFNNEGKSKEIGDVINKDDFMPGVFKISHKTFSLENLEGFFNLKVKGLSYAIYSIYYYTFNEEENEEYLDQDKVSMQLEKGEIIKDIFMDNHKFKVYSYNNSNINKTNLYISLIETDSIELELYVYKDLNDFSIIDDRIYGYLWKGNYYDYVGIPKNDKNYIENDILYIMIYKKTKTNNNVYTTFYLSITDENTPLFLNEGIEFKLKFDKDYYLQKFYYYYINDIIENQDLSISLSIFSGGIMVKVKVEDSIYFSEKIKSESYFILIRYFKIQHLCNYKSRCLISIEISNDKDFSYYSSFLIGVKSSKYIPIHLKQGVVNKRAILSGEEQHYIIDLKPDEKLGARITTYFNLGRGELYARKLLKSELYNITNFPNENNYEYISTYKSNNNNLYIIEIPYEEIANLNPCKILLTIKGFITGYYSGTKIEYVLSISNSLNELETNKNYRLFISQGEISYFHFKVGPNTKRLYISMSNKEQDAFMFLNYEKYITSISDYHWKNIGGYNEYLDLSVGDTFFTERKMRDIEGNYYLAIHALNDCFYTLYISTQDVKILTLSKNMPAGCSCEQKNEYCYFRYENINDPKITILNEQKLVFYTEYTYGRGILFGKVYPNGNMEEIINSLPSLTNNDFQGENEFLYITLNKTIEKYTLSSVLIIGIQCQEKSLFDLSAAILDKSIDISRNTDNFVYIKVNQDNIYYLDPLSGKINKFVFYISQDENLNFQIKAITGKAELHTFINGTLVYNKNFDDKSRTYKDYHHISDFIIDSNEENKKNYYGYVPKQYAKNNYFFAVIKPIDTCLININIHYDIEMSFIPLNKEIIAYVNHRYNYYGYFDLLKESNEVVITITSVEKSKQFKVFVKQNIIQNDLNEDLNSQTKYSKPSELNYDIKGESSSLTSALSLRIKNAPKKIRENSIVRILINLETKSYSYNDKFKIIITPVINNINTILPQPYNYYFTDIANKNNEKTLFILNNKNADDNIMVIEMSTCKGNYLYIVLDSPPLETETLPQLQERKIFSNSYSSNGKQIIIIRFLKVQEYYLLVFGDRVSQLDLIIHENDEENNKKNDKNKEKEASWKIEILLFYFTTNSKKYNYLVTEDSFSYESKNDNTLINFKLPELKKKDAFGKETYVDYMNYTFIVSEQKNDYEYMESTCYLTKLLQKYEKNNQYNYIKSQYDKKNNIMKVEGLLEGKTYYMNILAKNEYTGEIITYKPIMIVTTTIRRSVKLFSILFLSIVFIIFMFIAFYFYRKYRIKKAQIENFETTQDPDNIMKKSKKINLNVIKKDYTNLSEDNKEINGE